MAGRLDPVGHLSFRELEHPALVLRVLGSDGLKGPDAGGGDTATTAPSPVGSVFDRRMVSLPDPSAQRSTSPQARAATSDTLRPPSRSVSARATSTRARASAVSGVSSLPPLPLRGIRAVACMAAITPGIIAAACRWGGASRSIPLRKALTPSWSSGSRPCQLLQPGGLRRRRIPQSGWWREFCPAPRVPSGRAGGWQATPTGTQGRGLRFIPRTVAMPQCRPAQCSKRITFQHTFPLLRRSQSKPTPADRSAASDPIILTTVDRRRSGKPPIANPAPDFTKSTRATTVKRASAANAKQTPEERREYAQARSQTPERKEYRRQLRRNQIRIAKEAGKCKDCSNPAIPGQTKCETCAEKHRQRRRKDDANRRAKAKQAKDLVRATALEEKTVTGGPTKCRDCKKPPRPGQTRCERCAIRHNEYRRMGEAKKRAQAQHIV